MSVLPKSVEKVIEEFSKLPGIGPKSAARMAYHYLRSPNKDATQLAKALEDMDEHIHFCKECFNVTDKEICDICSSKLRDRSKVCVVEEPLDVVAFEKSGVFNGRYFVLGGVISPADGIGAEELRFKELENLVKKLLEEKDKIDDTLDFQSSRQAKKVARLNQIIFQNEHKAKIRKVGAINHRYRPMCTNV